MLPLKGHPCIPVTVCVTEMQMPQFRKYTTAASHNQASSIHQRVLFIQRPDYNRATNCSREVSLQRHEIVLSLQLSLFETYAGTSQ